MDMRTDTIRELNDTFRQTMAGGVIMVSRGVHSLPPRERTAVLAKVRMCDRFAEGDDPYGEHDFIVVEHGGEKFFAKIDYYDPDLRHGADDPADVKNTVRVITVMCASEY